jgi:hypothetical protein
MSTKPFSFSEEDTHNILTMAISFFSKELNDSFESYLDTCYSKENFVSIFKKIGEKIGEKISDTIGDNMEKLYSSNKKDQSSNEKSTSSKEDNNNAVQSTSSSMDILQEFLLEKIQAAEERLQNDILKARTKCQEATSELEMILSDSAALHVSAKKDEDTIRANSIMQIPISSSSNNNKISFEPEELAKQAGKDSPNSGTIELLQDFKEDYLMQITPKNVKMYQQVGKFRTYSDGSMADTWTIISPEGVDDDGTSCYMETIKDVSLVIAVTHAWINKYGASTFCSPWELLLQLVAYNGLIGPDPRTIVYSEEEEDKFGEPSIGSLSDMLKCIFIVTGTYIRYGKIYDKNVWAANNEEWERRNKPDHFELPIRKTIYGYYLTGNEYLA